MENSNLNEQQQIEKLKMAFEREKEKVKKELSQHVVGGLIIVIGMVWAESFKLLFQRYDLFNPKNSIFFILFYLFILTFLIIIIISMIRKNYLN